MLGWLSRSQSAKVLAQLAAHSSELTHAVLDALPQNKTTRYVRGVLVTTGVLPARQEQLAQLELWLTRALPKIALHHLRIIRSFAEWGVIRDARRRAARGRYTIGAARRDRDEIQVVIDFLIWLDENGLDLSALNQEVLDLWPTTHPTRQDALYSFIRWTRARRLTGPLELPRRRRRPTTNFLGEGDHHQQLWRCLNDKTLPREIRIIGALIRLYALPVSRIVELTTDRFHRDAHGSAYLTIDRHPVLLPPKLARLIEDQNTHGSATAGLNRALGNVAGYLLPGTIPGQPRNSLGTAFQLGQHGLPVLAARNTAMIEVVTDLPAIVVADLFGLHPDTALRWANQANDSWVDYLAAREITN